ncbi:hypothetical protein POM88_051087 [Heracleum sosnowskyi]|uniref:Endonuclease/exonuclease/phosphatase domain-containing protein n=1 Tax=Heracleum sosnowskyi TaxID=360622 RepID=A0AAD8GZW8_9APIA|nr:hypothetical protein POM88_051087 [Heracleum sosnowskyi]
MEWVCNNIGYEGLITVEPIGRSGGLALMWKEASQAGLLSFSVNHIDVVTKVNGMAAWRLTGIVGHQYTWEKGRGTNAWMEVRLDRVLTNEEWLKLFPLAKLHNTEGAPSDHSLIVLVPKRVAADATKRSV